MLNCFLPARQRGANRFNLTESVYKVVLQKSISAQIRQLILCISNDQGQVEDFCRN